MTLFYSDHDVELHLGKANELLADMPDESVDCIVTSPPYYGLRDYEVDGQIGLEETPTDYVNALRDVFREARRVLADDGVLWLNLGDSYSTPHRGSDKGWDKSRLSNPARVQKMQFASLREQRQPVFDRPYKSLLGMPWRVAFALQDDRWILRNDNIWHKTNAMPESVTDRLSSRHEYLFLFSKSRHYYFNLDAIKVPTTGRVAGNSRAAYAEYGEQTNSRRFGGNPGSTLDIVHETRNPGDVWTIPTQPFPGAHFAVMPPALVRPCVLAGSKEGGGLARSV